MLEICVGSLGWPRGAGNHQSKPEPCGTEKMANRFSAFRFGMLSKSAISLKVLTPPQKSSALIAFPTVPLKFEG